jgi:hypothetical protein
MSVGVSVYWSGPGSRGLFGTEDRTGPKDKLGSVRNPNSMFVCSMAVLRPCVRKSEGCKPEFWIGRCGGAPKTVRLLVGLSATRR